MIVWYLQERPWSEHGVMIECHFLACNWYPGRFDQQPLFGWHHWCELWCYLWSRCEADWIQARPDGFQRFWPLYQLGLLGIGELRSQPSQVQWLSQTPEMDWNGHLLVPMCRQLWYPDPYGVGPSWTCQGKGSIHVAVLWRSNLAAVAGAFSYTTFWHHFPINSQWKVLGNSRTQKWYYQDQDFSAKGCKHQWWIYCLTSSLAEGLATR